VLQIYSITLFLLVQVGKKQEILEGFKNAAQGAHAPTRTPCTAFGVMGRLFDPIKAYHRERHFSRLIEKPRGVLSPLRGIKTAKTDRRAVSLSDRS